MKNDYEKVVKSGNILEDLPRVKTWLNAEQFPVEKEVNKMPSMTVPDQTMSIQEIMKRYARGLSLGGSLRTPIYDNDEDFDNDLPDIRTMDYAEREEFAQRAQDEIAIITQKVKSETDAKKTKVVSGKPSQKDGAGEQEPTA